MRWLDLGEDGELKNSPVVIQERIEKAMSEEFDKLLEEKKQDRLLELVIEDKIDDLSIEEIKKELGVNE